MTSPVPSGVPQTYVGNIFTVALACVSRFSPYSSSVLILFLTSLRVSRDSRNGARAASICLRWAASLYATAVTMAAPFPLPLTDRRNRTSQFGTSLLTTLCRRLAYLQEKRVSLDSHRHFMHGLLHIHFQYMHTFNSTSTEAQSRGVQGQKLVYNDPDFWLFCRICTLTGMWRHL